MLKVLLRIFASLPLPLIHAAGKLLGNIMYFTNKKFAKNIRTNLLAVGIAKDESRLHSLAYKTTSEIGKGLTETFAIWFKPQHSVLKWVKACHGWEHVEAAWAQNRSIIFLTPHLGCYEITSLYYAARRPITVLYRPPRKSWLVPLIEEGRSRGQITLAPTNMSGVRKLLRALKKNEAIGILPDQVPDPNEGVWANFFGTPAYTMTLVSKLAESTPVTVLLAFGERLSWGRGYVIHIEPLVGEPTPQNINNGIEKLVRLRPAQYLWSYSRFKQP
jgi:KDO2-lipid IV(A) lauroyltransferase